MAYEIKRKREYISPSQHKLYHTDPEEYFKTYLSLYRPDRFPQTKAMAVGSAFDAFVKSHLYHHLFGTSNPTYELRAIFEAQVEEHVRDFAWDAGKHVFEGYKSCGALADLIIELGTAASEPQFEVEVRATASYRTKTGVPLMGKPDIFFINKHGAHVIMDWKVNGYCGTGNTSPMKGYKLCRDVAPIWSRTHNSQHKEYVPIEWNGMEVNGYQKLENLNTEWAVQLATYGWLHGESVGREFIAGIDQIVADARGPGLPKLRVAKHRSLISSKFQQQTMAQYEEMWERITSGWFFKELSQEESDRKCQLLDEQALAFYGPDASHDALLLRSLGC